MRDVSNQPRLRKADRRGLADEVADRVREAIFRGAYPPGEQLKETELSAELDVSRGPVREALVRLEGEGLVRSAWHRGATVTTLTARDVAEIDSLRSALEELAVRLVVGAADPVDLEPLERAARRMERIGDVHDMAACDIAFHDALYEASGHTRLVDAWRAIRNQVHLFLLLRIDTSAEDYLRTLSDEHLELVDVLRRRDLVTALDLFDRHRRRAIDVIGTTDGAAPETSRGTSSS